MCLLTTPFFGYDGFVCRLSCSTGHEDADPTVDYLGIGYILLGPHGIKAGHCLFMITVKAQPLCQDNLSFSCQMDLHAA